MLEKLKYVYGFLQHQRRSGTTTLLRKIAFENDVFVLAIDGQSAKQFGNGGIPIGILNFHGMKSKPVMIDNHTMLKLCEEAICDMEVLSLQLKQQDKDIFQLKQTIKLLVEKIERQEKLIMEFKN